MNFSLQKINNIKFKQRTEQGKIKICLTTLINYPPLFVHPILLCLRWLGLYS